MQDNVRKKISIDFDGVLAQHAAGPIYKLDKFSNGKFVWFQVLWNKIFLRFRQPYPNTYNCLLSLKQNGYELYLTTSRISQLQGITKSWLKTHNLYDLFDGFNFNLKHIAPWEFKYLTLKQGDFFVHVDDSPYTISKLIDFLPNQEVIYFNPAKNVVSGGVPVKAAKNLLCIANNWDEISHCLL